MLLNELTGVKDKAKMTATDILRTLKSDGIKMASGSYGMVLMKPDWDHVLKFFAFDPCYMMFVDYCLKNKSNKHLPKFKKPPTPMRAFFSKTEGKKKIDKFYAVKIEKLLPLSSADIRVIERASSRVFYNRYIMADDKDEFFKTFAKGEDLSKDRAFFELVFELRDIADEKKSCFLDFHEGNVMKRGSDLVVIDPFADTTGGLNKGTSIDLESLFYGSVLDELTRGEVVKTQNVTNLIQDY